MRCLVTAGNTLVKIDQVRCMTSIFSGKTGTQIALELHRAGHEVVLCTSRPETLHQLTPLNDLGERWKLCHFTTFDELHDVMKKEIMGQSLDFIVHSAAVSDYLHAGAYVPAKTTRFDSESQQFTTAGNNVAFQSAARGKIKSNHPEIWLRMIKAPKLVDFIKTDWGFQGKLVKFKLEVGVTREQLESIAENSRLQSHADYMVANTLEGMHAWAIIGPVQGGYREIARADLATSVVQLLKS